MLDLAEQIARTVDEAVAPVTADEARGRAGSRTHFRRTAVLACVVAIVVVGAVTVAVLAALGAGSHTTVRVAGRSGNTTISISPTTAPSVPIPDGHAAGMIDISKIDVHWTFVQGSSLVDEAKGPIHDPQSAMPGAPGTVVITGHRTTHGAPFFRLDELRAGDVIRLTTVDGAFDYRVDGSFVVPAEGDPLFPQNVLGRVSDRTGSLVLITNAPRYSSAERLAVTASQVSVVG